MHKPLCAGYFLLIISRECKKIFVCPCLSSVLWFGFWWVFGGGGSFGFDFVGFLVNFWDYFCYYLASPRAEQCSPVQQRMCISSLNIPWNLSLLTLYKAGGARVIIPL